MPEYYTLQIWYESFLNVLHTLRVGLLCRSLPHFYVPTFVFISTLLFVDCATTLLHLAHHCCPSRSLHNHAALPSLTLQFLTYTRVPTPMFYSCIPILVFCTFLCPCYVPTCTRVPPPVLSIFACIYVQCLSNGLEMVEIVVKDSIIGTTLLNYFSTCLVKDKRAWSTKGFKLFSL